MMNRLMIIILTSVLLVGATTPDYEENYRLSASAAVMVSMDDPDINFDGQILAINSRTAVLLSFELPNDHSAIEASRLYLYPAGEGEGCPEQDLQSIRLYATDAFDESAVTWNNAPERGDLLDTLDGQPFPIHITEELWGVFPTYLTQFQGTTVNLWVEGEAVTVDDESGAAAASGCAAGQDSAPALGIELTGPPTGVEITRIETVYNNGLGAETIIAWIILLVSAMMLLGIRERKIKLAYRR